MGKSKSWIKSLLIVVLALLLVFSLVACTKEPNEEPPKPGPPVQNDGKAAEYFSNLWKLTKKIGAEEIGAEDTVALDLGVELAINFRDKYSIVREQVDLGVEVQAVLDRKTTEENKNETAIKIRLYDPTNTATNTQILTLYLFAKDLNNLYLDFAGQNVVVPHTVATTIWNDVLGNKTELGDQLASGLTNQFIGKEGNKQSISDILNAFVGQFGDEWDLNVLINDLVSMFGLNLKDLIDKVADNAAGTMVLNMLGISSVDDIKDANGNVDLMKVLSGELISGVFNVTKQTQGNATVHKADVSDTLVGIALNLLSMGDIFSEGTSSKGELALIYTEEDNAIKDFSIFLKLGGLQNRMGNNRVTPEINIKINKLRIQNASTNDNYDKIDINKANYSPDIALNEKLSVKLDGVKYRGADFSGKTFELSLVGKIDMVETDTAKNNTFVNITLDEITETSTKHIIQASYKNGILAATLDEAITFNGKQYKGVKIDVSEKFNVAELIQNGIKAIVYKVAPSLKPADPAAIVSDGEENKKITDVMAEVMPIFKKFVELVLPMVSTENNGLQIDSSKAPGSLLNKINDLSIINIIATYANLANTNDKDWTKWTIENCTETAINGMLKQPISDPTADTSITGCLKMILEQFNIDLSDYGAEPAAESDKAESDKKIDWKAIQKAALQILYNIANDLTIEGVSDKDFTKDEITSIIGVKKDKDNNVIPVSDETLKAWNDNKVLIRNIIAVLQCKSVVVKGDLNGGAHASLEFTVEGASVEVKESLELIDLDNYTFIDVAEIIEQEKAEAEEEGNDISNLYIEYTWKK